MRISDWSSDVCSSDLLRAGGPAAGLGTARPLRRAATAAALGAGEPRTIMDHQGHHPARRAAGTPRPLPLGPPSQLSRGSGREHGAAAGLLRLANRGSLLAPQCRSPDTAMSPLGTPLRAHSAEDRTTTVC